MSDPLRALAEAMDQQVSAINARVVIERSRRTLTETSRLLLEDRARFLHTVRDTLRLFASEGRAAIIVEDLERRLSVGKPQAGQELLAFDMRDEQDLRMARSTARSTCLDFAASATEAQRVATAVSELGRNILTYTPGGRIEIEIYRGPPARVRLVASDRGNGISHLEEILAGRYRSKTGLGRGLLGVKRMMDAFRVQTGTDGTRIEAEVKFSC